MYGSTFDRLVDSIKNKRASGSKDLSSVVRRRRWIRYRVCTSITAKTTHITNIETLLSSKQRLETSIRDKRDDVRRVLAFESHRKEVFQHIAVSSYHSLLEAPIVLQRCIRKMRRFKTVYFYIVVISI